MTVFCGGETYESYPATLIIDKLVKVGWPLSIGYDIMSSPNLADLDGNGFNDIILDSHLNFYALNADTSNIVGWPMENNGSSPSKAAIGDIDGDGDLEAVVYRSMDRSILAYHRNGSPLWIFKVPSQESVIASTVLSDLDDDGKLETVFGTSSSTSSKLYVLDDNGSVIINEQVNGSILTTPAIGDLDSDGALDIVVMSTNFVKDQKSFYVFSADGTTLSGKTIPMVDPIGYSSIDRYEASPALADLDDDGNLEIIVGSPTGHVTAYDSQWNTIWEYIETNASADDRFMRSPAIGDIDDDGRPEVVICNHSYVYAFEPNGEMVNGWPVEHDGSTSTSSPVLYDLNFDGDLEIIQSSRGTIRVFEHTGEEILENSLITLEVESNGTPAVGDLDGNGLADIVLGLMDQKIHVWEVAHESDTEKSQWSSLHGNNRNTGNYEDIKDTWNDDNGCGCQ